MSRRTKARTCPRTPNEGAADALAALTQIKFGRTLNILKSHAHCHSSKRQEMSELTGKLRRSSRKITGPRQTILDILRKQHRPLTTKEILSAANAIDLATIYRSMHLLEKMQMVKRVDFGDGVARFELAGEDDDHHHHLICTQCGDVVAIEECFLREIESRLAAAHDFAAVTHKLEFFGVCSRCQKNKSSRQR